ncbi:MAG: segregation/condensation protein A [FCB group bacterium]|nr:segregation/condensation protein A [FCB group bacterium]
MTPTKIDYSVDLEVFQGPMDLLLYLIGKDEIDIYDIPVARITEQYMKYVEMLKLLNLENAGEYILMAATLIRIKAQMLLPRDTAVEDELDPREELTKALLEYRKYREAGDILLEKRNEEAHLTTVPGRGNGYKGGKAILTNSTSLFDLLNAFHDVMANFSVESSYFIAHQEITVEDRVKVILNRLTENEFATFEDLFADIQVKLIAIVTFMAILDLVKHQRVTIRQSVAFSELRIYRTERLHMVSAEAEPQAEPETESESTQMAV